MTVRTERDPGMWGAVRRRWGLGIGAVLALALACAASAPAAVLGPGPLAHTTRFGACPPARALLARTPSGAHAERALLCIVNRVRAHAGLRPLRVNRCLDRIAERHAREMVRRRYFAHSSANGRDLGQRARAVGYAARAASWTVGENLAWGVGRSGRAVAVVRAWLRSSGHRWNILHGAYRDAGVAVVRGTPVRMRGHTRRPRTITLDFGARRAGAACGAHRRARWR